MRSTTANEVLEHLNKSASTEVPINLNVATVMEYIFEDINKDQIKHPNPYQADRKIVKKKDLSQSEDLSFEEGDFDDSVSSESLSTEMESPPFSPIISYSPKKKQEKTSITQFKPVSKVSRTFLAQIHASLA